MATYYDTADTHFRVTRGRGLAGAEPPGYLPHHGRAGGGHPVACAEREPLARILLQRGPAIHGATGSGEPGRASFGDHDGREVGAGCRGRRHDRGVHHPEPVQAVHAASSVDHRQGIAGPAHPARPDRVEVDVDAARTASSSPGPSWATA